MLKARFMTPVLLFLALCFATVAFAEEDASMHQVYLAAEAGKFNEAQAMMDKVLKDHPNSAKAHFVEAELLAKQGLLSNAGVELNTAERLQPGLPFAKPETLQALKARIASESHIVIQPNSAHRNTPPPAKEWMPIALLILGIGIVVIFIVYMTRRNPTAAPVNNYAGNASGSPVGSGPAATGGMGSGLMSSLATGAAMGAGVVAGEALMHHFIDGDKDNVTPNHDNPSWNTANTSNDNVSQNDDMGGTDFGISDASSWDDNDASDDSNDWS